MYSFTIDCIISIMYYCVKRKQERKKERKKKNSNSKSIKRENIEIYKCKLWLISLTLSIVELTK